jgi:hypothetical protein
MYFETPLASQAALTTLTGALPRARIANQGIEQARRLRSSQYREFALVEDNQVPVSGVIVPTTSVPLPATVLLPRE